MPNCICIYILNLITCKVCRIVISTVFVKQKKICFHGIPNDESRRTEWLKRISREVIGVLSARDNFDLREAARSTWLKDYLAIKDGEAKAWFVVGKDDCKIPPQYRLSKYGCVKWNISESVGIIDHFCTSNELFTENCGTTSKRTFRQGFSFQINHPVVVRRLGVLHHLLVPNTEIKIAILDIQSQEIIVQTKVTSNTSYILNGYSYADVELIKLPKYYEGMVLLEGYLQTEACSLVSWNDGGGVITFNQVYSSPSHLESLKFENEQYSAASIQLIIDNIEGLRDIKNQENIVTKEWLIKLNNINEELQKENHENKDIVFVDVTDTYRNLPTKLLHFYQWLEKYEFSYFIKSDDDSVVDIPNLITRIQSHSEFSSDKQWMWSRLRKDWPVNYIGKWADYAFRSSIYPAFPCGATYVISCRIIRWLSSNANYLFSYQGEDVSMGIWLSAIKPDFIDDDSFECDTKCNKNSYNRAQLTLDQISHVWSLYENCSNLCSCK